MKVIDKRNKIGMNPEIEKNKKEVGEYMIQEDERGGSVHSQTRKETVGAYIYVYRYSQYRKI